MKPVTLIPKAQKDSMKRVLQTNFPCEYRCKNNKIFANSKDQRTMCDIQVDFIPEMQRSTYKSEWEKEKV